MAACGQNLLTVVMATHSVQNQVAPRRKKAAGSIPCVLCMCQVLSGSVQRFLTSIHCVCLIPSGIVLISLPMFITWWTHQHVRRSRRFLTNCSLSDVFLVFRSRIKMSLLEFQLSMFLLVLAWLKSPLCNDEFLFLLNSSDTSWDTHTQTHTLLWNRPVCTNPWL